MKVSDLEFHECENCVKRPRYSNLCKGCSHNHQTIEEAQQEIKRLNSVIEMVSDLTNLER